MRFTQSMKTLIRKSPDNPLQSKTLWHRAKDLIISDQHPPTQMNPPDQTFERRNFSEQIYTFWDDLADFTPEAVDIALQHSLTTLRQWLGADDACWMGAARLMDGESVSGDALNGWRIRVIKKWQGASAQPNQKPSQPRAELPYHPNRTIASQEGHFRVYSLCAGAIDLDTYQPNPTGKRCFWQHGIHDRLWIIFPVTPLFESCFCFDLHQENQLFGERELRIARDALRGIKWFHRQLLLSHGLGINQSPITPAERRVLLRLLNGDSEKSIAEELHLAPGSVHQYCVKIYRKYAVRGRVELMSLWIKTPSDTCAR